MQSSSDKIDDESVKFLQDVKKGKPRKFVMIKEGVQIDKLYVFKKGSFDRYVRSAKQAGIRGEAFWGVVRGDGVDIRFELSRSDGFEQPPGKEIRLKEFLKEEANLKFEPAYVIVETLTPVDETEGEATSQDEADEVNVEEDTGAKFIDLLKKILPHVKRALSKPTSVSVELKERVREAQALGRQREFQQGLATLRTVGQLTKQALAEAEMPQADTVTREFDQRSRQLGTLAGESQAENTSFGKEIARRIDKASTLARKGNSGRANEALQHVEELIKLAQAENNRREQWQEQSAQLEPRIDEAVQGAGPDVEQIRAITEYARTQAERQQYMKALVAVDRLEPLLERISV